MSTQEHADRTVRNIDPRRLPTFLIGGAQKAGTTALWESLRGHPDIGMARLKEPQFFTYEGKFGRGFEYYTALFAGTESRSARGEASTMYLCAPDSAHLISQSIPDVKLIFCLRDPVLRMHSNYWWDKRFRSDLPPFEEMVRTNHPQLQVYAARSHYAVQLARFRRHFADDQIKVVLSDDLSAGRRAVLQDVCAFVGVDPGALSHSAPAGHNSAARSRSVRLQRLLGDHRREWTRFLPRPAAGMLWRAKERALRMNAVRATYPQLPTSLRQQLIACFEEDVVYVERLTNRSLPAWRT